MIVLRAPDGGTVGVHPVVFHQVLDLLDVSGWQVSQQKQGLRVLVARPSAGFDQSATERRVRAALAVVIYSRHVFVPPAPRRDLEALTRRPTSTPSRSAR